MDNLLFSGVFIAVMLFYSVPLTLIVLASLVGLLGWGAAPDYYENWLANRVPGNPSTNAAAPSQRPTTK